MSLHATPSSERVHIGLFGLRNAGKSSLINALTAQSLSIVSPTPGTTTDTVQKAMELLPLGPVVLLDTPGFDDEGELGELRVAAARKALDKTDLAILVADATRPLNEAERAFLDTLRSQSKAHLVVFNKCDLGVCAEHRKALLVSSKTGEGIDALKAALAAALPQREEKGLLNGLLPEHSTVLLVTPIDESAPKGRIILPQQQTLRSLLDLHAITLVCQPEEVKRTLSLLALPPDLVVCDSQAFAAVARDVPAEIPLTSFSILFARYKGNLAPLVRSAAKIRALTDSSRVLISEGCTHHRQCGDIGTVKLPAAIRRASGASPQFSFTSGTEFPADTSGYDLIIHCGGCMLGESEMKSRLSRARAQNTPITNYGIALSLAAGILERALAPFPEVRDLLAGESNK